MLLKSPPAPLYERGEINEVFVRALFIEITSCLRRIYAVTSSQSLKNDRAERFHKSSIFILVPALPGWGIRMGYVPDLKETEWWHETDFAYSKSIPEKFTAIMVGWIGDRIPNTGEVSNEIIEKLEWAYDNRAIDQGWLGEHECEICNTYTDHGEILVIDDDKMYVAPKMILHYIKDHSYRPPEEFIDAVDTVNVT